MIEFNKFLLCHNWCIKLSVSHFSSDGLFCIGSYLLIKSETGEVGSLDCTFYEAS